MSQTKQAPKGYPALAQLMAGGKGMAIFKLFAEMQVNSLLMRQAELLHLEDKLRKRHEENQRLGNDVNKQFSKLVETEQRPVSQSPNIAPGSTPSQTSPELSEWALHVDIRGKLKEYNDALLQFAQINKLPRPQPHDVHILRKWYEHESGGDIFFERTDQLDWVWPEDDSSDLAAATTRNFDLTTQFAAEKVVPFLLRRNLQKKEYMYGDENLGLVRWNDSTYETTSRWLTVITSALMPCLAIIVLYYIPKLIHRIIAATCFTFLFSTAIALFTSSRAPEIFAATVGFSAVEVVFIGSTQSNSTA